MNGRGQASIAAGPRPGALGALTLSHSMRWATCRWPRSALSSCFRSLPNGLKAAVIVTTNLPFSEWTSVIPNARLCKALIDRITDRANIIETGTESYRFRRTLEKRKGKGVNNQN